MMDGVVETIGYGAALCTGAAFYCKGMVALRIFAIAANAFFIVYAAARGINPVLLLHCLLLPINIRRLIEALNRNRSDFSRRSA